MSLGRGLTQVELELVQLIVKEVREHGKANSSSYLGMLPAWREIVDAVLCVEEHGDLGSIFADMFPGEGRRRLDS